MEWKRPLIASIIFLMVILFVLTTRLTLEGSSEITLPVDETATNQEFSIEGKEEQLEGENSNEPFQETNKTISKMELSLHTTEEDCWIAFQEKVYDITDYLPKHPGGKNKILAYCGTSEDFSTAFTNQHGTTKISLLMKIGVFIGDFDVVGEL